jgi:hypothetical protein
VKLRAGIVVGALIAGLLLASPVLAAQRWVAPTKQGAGDCSSQASAGTIKEGFEMCGGQPLVAGDEIIVTPGSYPITETLHTSESVSIHGLPGSPRPTIEKSSGAVGATLSAPNAQISYLAVENDQGGGAAISEGASIENVIATATGSDGVAILAPTLVRDSVAQTNGANGVAIETGPGGSVRAENVTAFSVGPSSYGVEAFADAFRFPVPPEECFGFGGQVTAENLIAHGAADDLAAVNAGDCPPLPAPSITVDHSNYDMSHTDTTGGYITDNGNNQTSAAQTEPGAIFLAPGVWPPNLHELATAPTIDGGVASMLGPSDPDGNPRTLGAAPDIGAFEFVPPPSAPMPTSVMPTISNLTESNRRWREGNALASISRKKPALGTTFSFMLNEPADANLSFTREVGGRRVKGKCVAQTKKNTAKHRCARSVVAGALTFAGHAGGNKVAFQGRISRSRKLKPGRYTLVIAATNTAGQKSAPQMVSFTIVK